MAILSALFSLLAKEVGNLLQAVFGWSITALFGRLPSAKQTAISVALVLSLVWPVFLVGLVFPRAAVWTLAFVPLHDMMHPGVLRIVWVVLSVVTPAVVGLITRWVAPSTKGGPLRAALGGYPLALGYAAAFLITAVTVPIVKIASAIHGWSDQHVYVQPRPDRYAKVLHELAEACALAGITPSVEKVPVSMALSTKVLTALARGAIDPIVADEPKLLRGEGIEIYLYPADLLLRGSPEKVAHVRAMMTRTMIERDAYLVATPEAQELQDRLGRLWEAVSRHGGTAEHLAEPMARNQLAQAAAALDDAESVPFDDWIMLERIARRIERALASRGNPNANLIDERHVGLFASDEKEKVNTMAFDPNANVPRDELSTTTLVKEAMDEAKELVRVEVQLAKDEVRAEVKKAEGAAIGFGVAAACSLSCLTMLAVALVLALGGTAVAALIVAGGFLVMCAVAAFVGYSLVPKKPLDDTRKRLETDVQQLKEHVL